jgi:hypothetical protein
MISWAETLKPSVTSIACLALILGGCTRVEHAISSEGKTVVVETNAIERCYQGVVYLHFSEWSGKGSSYWGGAKVTPDGKIVTCTG